MDHPNIDDIFATNSQPLLITGVIFIVLSWIAVGLRTYTRACLIRAFRLDDWIMLMAQLTFTIYGGFLFAGIERGIGRHNVAIEDSDREVAALKWQALAIGMYIALMMLVKMSIGFFLLRITYHMAVYAWIISISLVVIFIFSVVIFFWNIFQCSPVEKQWDYRLTYGRCVRPEEIVSVAYAVSAMTILTDFFYALLPIPLVWGTKMSREAKVTVVLILGMGIFASVATILRIRLLPNLTNLDDLLYAGTDAMIWTIVEAGLAVIAASLATIRPLLRELRVPGFEGSDTSVEGGSTELQALHPRTNRQKRFFQFYGINDMPLTDVTTTNILSGADEDRKSTDRLFVDTEAQSTLSRMEASYIRDDVERGRYVGACKKAPRLVDVSESV